MPWNRLRRFGNWIMNLRIFLHGKTVSLQAELKKTYRNN
jgi:hypothetical protein